TLTVLDPAITTQPVSHAVLAGDTGNLFAGVAGTVPLSYQWRFNGADIPDATSASLNVTNFQASNQGAYTLVVTNNLGSTTTSSPAILSLFATPANLITRWDFDATNSLTANTPTPS